MNDWRREEAINTKKHVVKIKFFFFASMAHSAFA